MSGGDFRVKRLLLHPEAAALDIEKIKHIARDAPFVRVSRTVNMLAADHIVGKRRADEIQKIHIISFLCIPVYTSILLYQNLACGARKASLFHRKFKNRRKRTVKM